MYFSDWGVLCWRCAEPLVKLVQSALQMYELAISDQGEMQIAIMFVAK